MKIDPKIMASLGGILNIFQPIVQHLPFLSTIVLLGFLIFAVYSITQVLQQPSDDTYRAEQLTSSVQTHFDQATITAIKNLRTSQNGGAPTFAVPQTRVSPFTE